MEVIISILCKFICVYDVTDNEIQFNHSKLCNFTSSSKMVKTSQNFRSFSSIKLKKMQKKKLNGLNSKLYNFLTLWNLIKMAQDFVQGIFFHKSSNMSWLIFNVLHTPWNKYLKLQEIAFLDQSRPFLHPFKNMFSFLFNIFVRNIKLYPIAQVFTVC